MIDASPLPLVLVALDETGVDGVPLARTVVDALGTLECRVRKVEPGAVVDVMATERPTLLVVQGDADGLVLVERARVRGVETIGVFTSSATPVRAAASALGAWEHVCRDGGSDDVNVLVALVQRVLARGGPRTLDGPGVDVARASFRPLVENGTDGIFIVKGRRTLYVNRRLTEMMGYSEAELTAEDFILTERLVHESNRTAIRAREERLARGQPVESRFEVVAQRKNGERFHAEVSVSFVELSGQAGALGIVHDITQRQQFEQQMLRKNRELALLNELSQRINQALALDDTLAAGCKEILALLDAEAAGITLLTPDGRGLELRVSEGLSDPIIRSLVDVPLHSTTLVAQAVRTGEVIVVDDIATDARVALDAVRSSRFAGCIVVPLLSRVLGEACLGAAFVFTRRGHTPTLDDRELMVSIGTLLGNAVEKSLLLESDRMAVRRLVALDEIAMAIASTLDVDEVALTVAHSVHRLLGAVRVMIARLDGAWFVPVHVLDGGEPVAVTVPIPVDDTIMGMCLREKQPVQRLRAVHDQVPTTLPLCVDPLHGHLVELLPHEAEMFGQGVSTAVAVPILQDGMPIGALWLGYVQAAPLPTQDLAMLSSLGTHVAIATKNSALFAARQDALEELRAAQDKLVASEKLNAIGLIAHGVAHDFNNVLGSILGRTQLLRTALQKEPLQDRGAFKHVDIIETAARDGAETVRRIQEIGRQDSDHRDDFTRVDLRALVDDVAELTQPKWRGRARDASRSIELTTRLSDDAAFVLGNASELREVLINLVHNAVDAMPNGGRIVLSTHVTAQLAEVHVDDTGTGMPDEMISRIFDPYFTTKGADGTGLGLSVSQAILRRHGGDIRVVSRMGDSHGTSFQVSLPKCMDVIAAAPPLVDDDTSPSRVLVLDDEENIREILREILEDAGHEVVLAADGPAGLEQLRDRRFDLVLTDLGLPGMSGYEVAQQIKAAQPSLFVALVTGWGATLDADKAATHGVDRVISKPFRFEELLPLVLEARASSRKG